MEADFNTNDFRKVMYIEEWLDSESSVPLKVQRRLASLLEEHPGGIKITDLSLLYKKKYSVSLNAVYYEATSLLHLVSQLNNIFRQVILKGKNVILFPAFLPESAEEISLKKEIDQTPEEVKENMKKLLVDAKINNPWLGGIYYDDFLNLYQERYKSALDYKNYNSSTFEEFISKHTNTWLKQIIIAEKSVLVYNLEDYSPTKQCELVDLQKMDRKDFPLNVISPHEQLKELNLNEEFKVGDKINVFIPQIYNCNEFYIHLQKYAKEMDILENAMDEFYNNNEEREPMRLPKWAAVKGVYCATYHEERHFWFRVKIDKLFITHARECFYVDNGKKYKLNPRNLYYLPKRFAKLPMQAICASLAGAKPVNCEWSAKENERFRSLTMGDSIVARIVKIDEKKLLVDLFAKDENILDLLISDNLAKRQETDYFEVTEEHINVPCNETSILDNLYPTHAKESSKPDCFSTPSPLHNQQDDTILSPKISASEEEELRNLYESSTSFNESQISLPSNFNSPPPFYQTSSMPILTSQNKSASFNNSLTNCPIQRPPRSTSTPAVVQSCQFSQILNSPCSPPNPNTQYTCWSLGTNKSSNQTPPPLTINPETIGKNPSTSSNTTLSPPVSLTSGTESRNTTSPSHQPLASTAAHPVISPNLSKSHQPLPANSQFSSFAPAAYPVPSNFSNSAVPPYASLDKKKPPVSQPLYYPPFINNYYGNNCPYPPYGQPSYPYNAFPYYNMLMPNHSMPPLYSPIQPPPGFRMNNFHNQNPYNQSYPYQYNWMAMNQFPTPTNCNPYRSDSFICPYHTGQSPDICQPFELQATTNDLVTNKNIITPPGYSKKPITEMNIRPTESHVSSHHLSNLNEMSALNSSPKVVEKKVEESSNHIVPTNNEKVTENPITNKNNAFTPPRKPNDNVLRRPRKLSQPNKLSLLQDLVKSSSPILEVDIEQPSPNENINSSVDKLVQEDILQPLSELYLSGHIVHKVILNNKTYFLENEILNKFSTSADTIFIHTQKQKFVEFIPSRSEYPQLYKELKKIDIDGLSSLEQDIHLIPLNELLRFMYVAGVASDRVLDQALNTLMKHATIMDF